MISGGHRRTALNDGVHAFFWRFTQFWCRQWILDRDSPSNVEAKVPQSFSRLSTFRSLALLPAVLPNSLMKRDTNVFYDLTLIYSVGIIICLSKLTYMLAWISQFTVCSKTNTLSPFALYDDYSTGQEKEITDKWQQWRPVAEMLDGRFLKYAGYRYLLLNWPRNGSLLGWRQLKKWGVVWTLNFGSSEQPKNRERQGHG